MLILSDDGEVEQVEFGGYLVFGEFCFEVGVFGLVCVEGEVGEVVNDEGEYYDVVEMYVVGCLGGLELFGDVVVVRFVSGFVF